MKRLLMGIVSLVLAASAQAASFDCANAGAKVEKLICADAELSRLDEELNTVYKTALQDEKQAEATRQTQKQWMKERNGCSDAACVKRAYETRLSLLMVTHTLSDSTVAIKKNVTLHTSEEWHCELESTPEARKYCEQARDAKPFPYEIKSVLPGKGYSLCELMLANMRAQTEPMSCEFKIAPKYQKYFSLPEWEDIDPWADIDLLWKADVRRYGISPQRKELEKLTREQWLEQFKRDLQQSNLKPIMRRARFDFNGDGKVDWVLAYQLKWNEPCNPWRGGQGYSLYMLSEDGKSLGRYADVTGGQVPFFFNLQDPRFTGAHTYRFTFYGGGGLVPFQIDIYGSASREGVDRSTACHYEQLNFSIHSTK